jgi:4-hydroxy-tetrahydrodipicolinate synthase
MIGMTDTTMLRGVYTALITPMTDSGLDIAAFEALIEWQIEQGVNGLVPCGTTGESPTLTHDEHKKLIEIAVKVASGRTHIMAGVGSNATSETLDLIRHAEKFGADSALVVSPYYNKPNAEGQCAHYKAVADATALPVIIYNIPGRSVIDISDDTMLKIADMCDNVIGVKDATGDLARVATLKHRAGDRLALLSGEDMTALAFNALGGQGCISVSANAAPAECAALQTASLAYDYRKAQDIHAKLVNLHEVMFCETSPAPVKYALSRMGKCKNILRLPLVSASDIACEQMDMALFELGII